MQALTDRPHRRTLAATDENSTTTEGRHAMDNRHRDDRHRALELTGGVPLTGTFRVNAAKNSALFLMLGAVLTCEPVVLKNIPRLSDILVMVELLRHFGVRVEWAGRDLVIRAETLHTCAAPYHLVSKMRASFVALGPLLGRCGQARMPMPGGCAFGPRPVDRHIKAFEVLGATTEEADGDFVVSLKRALEGTVRFEAPTVGGTHNVILASALGEGVVRIENAALEPEIADLCDMLNAMGARIGGVGTATLTIEGVPRLGGVTFEPIPDRIEAGTVMLAVAATRGSVLFENVRQEHVQAVTRKLAEAGAHLLWLEQDKLLLEAQGTLSGLSVAATEYPGIPTDLQAPFGAFLLTAEGQSEVSDHVYFEHRFTHVAPLLHLGADMELSGNRLVIQGGRPLVGATMHAPDIRAGGALVVAALAAAGTSVVTGLEYIERGYERLAERLQGLGAAVRVREAATLSVLTGTYGD
jgi:UDP-N-acetylglucosamine 1-carboxyvinyltransferase